MTKPIQRAVEKRRARELKANPQVRKTFPSEEVLRNLGKSVIRRLIHPLIIRADNTLIDGECRWRGVMLIDPEHELDVLLSDRELTPEEVIETQLVSAIHTNSVPAYDQAVACRDWLAATKGTAKELAERIDRDPSTVTRLNSLWSTVPPVIEAAAVGKLGLSAWYSISLVKPEEQPSLLEMHLAGLPRDQIAELSRKKRQPKQEQVKQARVRCPLSTGVVVTVAGPEMTLSEYLDALTQAREAAMRASKDSLDIRTAEKVWRDRAKVVA